jgi:hypothetical protein
MAIKTPSLTTVAELGGRFFARLQIGRWQNFFSEILAPQWNYNVEAGLVSESGGAIFPMLTRALQRTNQLLKTHEHMRQLPQRLKP